MLPNVDREMLMLLAQLVGRGENINFRPMTPLPGAGVQVPNQDGTVSSERTIGVNINGREYVIPTLVGGKQLTTEQAIEEAKRRGLKNYPSFDTIEKASRYATFRSDALGRQKNGETNAP